MKVVIIGSGNVATVLGRRIALAGHKIVQVASRTLANAEKLALILRSTATATLPDIDKKADLYLIAVNDNQVEDVASLLQLQPGRIIVHTAGSVSKEVLKNAGCSYGVLYPLQSLRKEMPQNVVIPVYADGNDQTVTDMLTGFACTWASTVSVANDEQRLKLHLAAVIASNFTNHLYALAGKYCTREGLDFNSLYPLIQETASRITSFPPEQLQTGPAVRGDNSTIEKHLEMLKDHPYLKNVYGQLSQSITEFYGLVD
jgi:predicted short-subunit dehydrogenase-like oxidoreductase (DUF2520 family)